MLKHHICPSRASFLQALESFGADVVSFSLERIGGFMDALGYRFRPSIQILFDPVAELSGPFVFKF